MICLISSSKPKSSIRSASSITRLERFLYRNPSVFCKQTERSKLQIHTQHILNHIQCSLSIKPLQKATNLKTTTKGSETDASKSFLCIKTPSEYRTFQIKTTFWVVAIGRGHCTQEITDITKFANITDLSNAIEIEDWLQVNFSKKTTSSIRLYV